LLTEGRFVDAAIIFIMAKKFILPFTKWKAFQLGIIDAKGKRTKKVIRTTEERSSYTLLDRFIRRLRVIVGDRLFLKVTLTYLLLKDCKDYFPQENQLLTEDSDDRIKLEMGLGKNESLVIVYEDKINEFIFFLYTKLGDNITSKFGFDSIKKKGNEGFIDRFNEIFNNLFTGGYEEFEVSDTVVKVNYGDGEISIESEKKFEESLNMGKVYIPIENKNKTQEIIDFWNRFMEVKNGKR